MSGRVRVTFRVRFRVRIQGVYLVRQRVADHFHIFHARLKKRRKKKRHTERVSHDMAGLEERVPG